MAAVLEWEGKLADAQEAGLEQRTEQPNDAA